MKKSEVIEIAKSVGIIANESDCAVNALGKSVPLSWLIDAFALVEQATLERSAKHFDKYSAHLPEYALAAESLREMKDSND